MPLFQTRPIAANLSDASLYDMKETKHWQSHLEMQYNQEMIENQGMQYKKSDTNHNPHTSMQSFGTVSSTLSSPTLVSDASSLRSSLSSVSSPVLNSRSNRTSSQSGSNSHSSVSSPIDHLPNLSANFSTRFPHRRQNSAPLVDNTSMASLTIDNSPSRKKPFMTRSHKQREMEFDDDDDDIMPNDDLMFNVPMSPALYAQQNVHSNESRIQRSHSQHKKNKYHQRKLRRPQLVQDDAKKSHSPLHVGLSVNHQSCLSPLRQPRPLRQTSPSRRSVHTINQQHLPSIHENLDGVTLDGKHMVKRNSEPIPLNSSVLSIPASISRRASLESLGAPTIYRVDSDVSDITMELHKLESQRLSRTDLLNSRPGSVNSSVTALPIDSSSSGSSKSSRRSSDECSSSRRSSLTRPENLPPKTPEEERRHLKEYEQLMKYAVAADKRKQQKAEDELKQKVKQAKQDLGTWNNWLSKGTKAKLSTNLKWRGIPEGVRGSVWLAQKGGVIGHTDKLLQATSSPDDHKIIVHSELIWPECGMFGNGQPLHDSLLYVVQQFLANRPELPYSDAMVSLSALLLLYLDASNALLILLNIVKPDSLLHAIFCGNERITSANYVSFNKILYDRFANLNEHLGSVDISDSELLNPMISGLFTTIMPSPNLAARLMDVFIFEGDTFLLRASLGILRINEAWLYTSRSEILQQLQKPRITKDDEFMTTIREVTRT